MLLLPTLLYLQGVNVESITKGEGNPETNNNDQSYNHVNRRIKLELRRKQEKYLDIGVAQTMNTNSIKTNNSIFF